MFVPNWVGAICILIAILVFGFLSVSFKLKFVINRPPLLIQFFMSIVVFFGSLPPILFFADDVLNADINTILCAFMGALCWVFTSCLSIFGVRFLGISIAQAIWSGVTMITSFLYGVFIFDEIFNNIWISTLGLMLLILGVPAVSLTNVIPNIKFPLKSEPPSSNIDENASGYNVLEDEPKLSNSSPSLNTDTDSKLESKVPSSSNEPIFKTQVPSKDLYNTVCIFLFGCCLVGIMGFFNTNYAAFAKLDSTFNFIFYFGVFQLLIASFVIMTYWVVMGVITGKRIFTRDDYLYTAISGTMSGTLWVIGNYAMFFAIVSDLGLYIGFVLIQTTIIISTLVGMFFFKEVQGLIRRIYLIGLIFIILLGAVLLFVYGK